MFQKKIELTRVIFKITIYIKTRWQTKEIRKQEIGK